MAYAHDEYEDVEEYDESPGRRFYGDDPTSGARLLNSRYRGKVAKLNVFWMNPATAEKEYMTPLPSDATLETLIATVRKPGRFYLVGLDHHGNEVTNASTVQTIAKDNAILKQLAEEPALAAATPMMATGPSDPVIELLRAELEQMREENRRRDAEFRRREEQRENEHRAAMEALTDERAEVSKERVALAVTTNASATELNDRVVSAISENAAAAQSQIVAIMSAQMEASQQRADIERMAREQEIKLMEKRHEIDLKRMDAEARARREEAKEERARLREESEARLARQREEDLLYRERMSEFWAKQLERKEDAADPIGQLMDRYGPLLQTLGVDVSQLGSKLLGGGGGILDTVAGTLGKAMDRYFDIRQLELEAGGGETNEDGEQTYPVQLEDGRTVQLTAEQIQQIQQLQAQQQQQQGGPVAGPMAGPMAGAPQIPAYGQQPGPAYQGQPLESGQFAPQGAYQEMPAYQAPPPPPTAPAPRQPFGLPGVGADLREVQLREAFPVSTLKAVRASVRSLVERLNQTPEVEWQGLITEMVLSNPDTIGYLQLRSIFDAVIKADGTPDLAERLIVTIDQSGLVPADIPRR